MESPLAPRILYEDNHLLAVCKPGGMLSQGDESGDKSVFDWARDYLKTTYHKPGEVYLALLHRLDRPVGGVQLLAKTGKAAARLSKDWQAHQVQKTYWAVVHGVPPETTGTLTHWLRKLPDKNIVRAYKNPGQGAKEAVLNYRLLARVGDHSLLEVVPRTGRQHQIRVQLAAMGCPIVGDVKYGKSDFLPDRSIALWSRQLRITHPTLKEVRTFTAEPPALAVWRPFASQGKGS
ncbi:MAG: RluA family pseudouridine synthase [Bacteroidetes bacterium]|jgi:23S rRNA pseudouridine1911/1915/1917 synthase|nr:RluA family pseudouridine synthase [Bacteroidota bacterium]